MTSQEIEVALSEELRRIAPDVDIADIDRTADLREQFDIDSMDFLNLIAALNKRYNIPIPETDYPRFATFSSAVRYLAAKTSAP